MSQYNHQIFAQIDQFNFAGVQNHFEDFKRRQGDSKWHVDHVNFSQNILYFAARKVAAAPRDKKRIAREFLSKFVAHFRNNIELGEGLKSALTYALFQQDADAFIELLNVWEGYAQSLKGSRHLLWDIFADTNQFKKIVNKDLQTWLQNEMMNSAKKYLGERFTTLSTAQKQQVLLTYIDLSNNYGLATTKQDIDIYRYLSYMPWHVQAKVANKRHGIFGEIYLWAKEIAKLVFLVIVAYFFYQKMGDIYFWGSVLPYTFGFFLKAMTPITWLSYILPSSVNAIFSYLGIVCLGIGGVFNLIFTAGFTLASIVGFFLAVGYVLQSLFINMFHETVDFSSKKLHPVKARVLDGRDPSNLRNFGSGTVGRSPDADISGAQHADTSGASKHDVSEDETTIGQNNGSAGNGSGP